MEKLGVELTLNDKISAAANKAAAALKRVEDQTKKAQKALGLGGQIDKVQQQLNALRVDPKGFQNLLRAQKSLREERDKLKKATEGFGAGLRKGMFAWATPYGGGRVWSNVAGELLARSIVGAGNALVSAAEKASEVLTSGFRAAMRKETTTLGFTLSLGKAGGTAALTDIGRFAGKTPFDEGEISPLLLQMRRAGVSQQSARTAFAIAGDLAAGQGRGTSIDTVSEILDTLTHIQLKGGINEKRLVGMGINAPDFYKTLAKRMGVSVETAKQRAENGGGRYSQAIINAIGAMVEKQQGGVLGMGTIKASRTMEAQLHKLSQLPDNYLKAIASSPAWDKLTQRMASVLEQLDPNSERGQRIQASLINAFGKLADLVDKTFTPENIDAAISALEKLPDTLKEAAHWAKILGEAWLVFKGVNAVATITDTTSTTLGLAMKALKLAGVGVGAGVGATVVGVGGVMAIAAQQERQTQALMDSFNAQHPVDTTAAKYFGTEYAREHHAVMRRGSMQVGDFGKAPQVNVNVHMPVTVHEKTDNPTHTAQKIAVETKKQMVAALGQASQEMGH
jgi:hypothetical protein